MRRAWSLILERLVQPMTPTARKERQTIRDTPANFVRRSELRDVGVREACVWEDAMIDGMMP